MARGKTKDKPLDVDPIVDPIVDPVVDPIQPSAVMQLVPTYSDNTPPVEMPACIKVLAVRGNDLHHPFQKKWISTIEPRDLVLDSWLKSQLAGGLIVEVKE